MLSNSQISKIFRKQKRCLAIISKETEIKSCDSPTEFLGICNAGLSTGLQEEILVQEALKYGKISEVVMIPNKSYCFLRASSLDDAISIYDSMHGISKIGQNDTVVYLGYFEGIPNIENLFGELPPGLIILENFVDSQEEEILLKSVLNQNTDKDNMNSLKHRVVKHFGYEFLYGTNQIDPEKPLDRKIPNECNFLWIRLKEKIPMLEWYEPDQLTVNQYSPGQGIPSHVDTHSAFLDPLFVVSLEGDVVMEFKQKNRRINVLIPQRSLLIMSNESRYDWTHGITPRYMDVIPSERGGLTVKQRLKRTSFTFRKLRKGSCICIFPRLCDTRQNLQKNDNDNDVSQDLKDNAQKLETENVHKVYDEIANHFSRTRHTPWPKVSQFLNSFEQGSVILDIGCGNGKYLDRVYPSAIVIGCDRSEKLLSVCYERKFNIFRCDCLSLSFRDDCVDGCISIAVIHHLATQERRLQAIKEMVRILRPNGRGLIYVWAKNQEINNKKSNYLRQGKRDSKENKRNVENAETEIQQSEKLECTVIQLPIHVNRTQFEKQDVFVPWKLKNEGRNSERNNCRDAGGSNETFLRYYHVFKEDELEDLCKTIENIEIEKTYYDEGNWCIVFRKL